MRYVLDGSLRKGADRIRVTARLVEAEAGKQVWAERYDREITDIFALKDEITEAITTAIAPAIGDVERRIAMRKPASSFDAWGTYQRGLWHVSKFSKEDNALAQECFRQVIEHDPNFPGGYRGLAVALIQAAGSYLASGQEELGRKRRHWRAGRSSSTAATPNHAHITATHCGVAEITTAPWPKPNRL